MNILFFPTFNPIQYPRSPVRFSRLSTQKFKKRSFCRHAINIHVYEKWIRCRVQEMRIILLDHRRYCLINKMVLARAAYNLAEGSLGTKLYLPPPQAHLFFVFRSEASAKRMLLVTKRKGRWEWVPPSFATIFIERETSRNKAKIIRFDKPRLYPLSLRELRTRFRSFFSAFDRQTAGYTGYNPLQYKQDENQPKFWSVVSDVFEPQVLESNLIFSNFPITECSTSPDGWGSFRST